jgi:hypothetical protein
MRFGVAFASCVFLQEGFWTAPVAFAVHSVVMTCREYAANPTGHIPPSGDSTAIPMEDAPLFGLRSSAMFWRADLDRMFAIAWRILRWAPLLGVVLLPLLPGAARLTFLALLAVLGGAGARASKPSVVPARPMPR